MKSKIYILFLLIFSCSFYNAQICFKSAVAYSVGINPKTITKGDFNTDGKIDLMTSNSGSGDVSLILGDGLGGFSSPMNFSVTSGTDYVMCADFNNDGKLDIAVTSTVTNDISVLLGNGMGGFGSPLVTVLGPTPYSIKAADFDKDGNLDIIASTGTTVLLINYGTGNGFFPTVSSHATTAPYNFDVITCDLNKDGTTDMVSISVSRLSSFLYSTSGSTLFTNTSLGVCMHELESADINGDGNLDIVTSDCTTKTLLGNGTGSFTAFINPNIYSGHKRLALADFNGDGNTDAIFGWSGAGMDLNYGSASGIFGTTVVYSVPSNMPDIVAADFNGDGMMDVAATSFTTNTVQIFINSSPTISVVSSNTLICPGQTTTLSVSGASTYTWNTSSTNTSIAVSPSVTTTYSVTGTGTNSCKYTMSFTQTVSTCAGIYNLNETEKSLVSVYPNPNNGSFKIRSKENVEINLTNEIGQTIFSERLNESNNYELKIENVASGIYFINANNGLRSFNQKISVIK